LAVKISGKNGLQQIGAVLKVYRPIEHVVAVIRLALRESLAGEKVRNRDQSPFPVSPPLPSQCQIISKFLPR